MKQTQRVILAAKHRRNIHGRRRDYTSITDELELMIAASPPLELHKVTDINTSVSPAPVPAILIETECLHDAEEADYDLMETIIHQRLRRDSTNLHASFEDLANRSIIDGSHFGTPEMSPAPVRRQENVGSAEEILHLENEKKLLDIKVIRRDSRDLALETDSQEMKTCLTSTDLEQTPEKKLDDDETKC